MPDRARIAAAPGVFLAVLVAALPAGPLARAASAPAGAHSAGAATAAGARTLVVCAPGYPGTTDEAQPTMDAFARAAEAAAGWTTGSLHVVYDETLDGGRARLQA